MTTKFDSHVILVKHYTSKIEREFRWDRIVHEASQETETNEYGERFGRTYLGTTLGLYPSGKIYTCWTTNQTSSDVRRDEAFSEALEAVAAKHNGYISYDDECLFFEMPILDHESTEEDLIEDASCFDSNE